MFFLPHQPKTYPTQPRFRYCSAYQIAAIASAYGREITRPHDTLSGFAKVSGFCLPGYLCNRIRDLSHDARIMQGGNVDMLKQLLAQHHVAVLCLGHAYDDDGFGFDYIKAVCFQHYVSVWGYDSIRDGFWVYDSAIPQGRHVAPIGNLFLDATLLSRCWAWGGLGLYNNLLIAVKPSQYGHH